MTLPLEKADNVAFHDTLESNEDDRAELLAGLQQEQKAVSPKWFYDPAGSELFEQITRLPEYYLTRTEIGILSANREEISARLGEQAVVIEPGSGSSEKIRLLLDTLKPAAYVPIDISAQFLEETAHKLGLEFPWLDIRAICADFNTSWDFLAHIPQGRRVVFYPGSTLGNLEPAAAERFLQRVRNVIGPGGALLIGVDLHKDTARLQAAYNDAAGVTGQFNLNVLHHLNESLDADFDKTGFRHHAFYNEEERRIEMHLVSKQAQQVRVDDTRLHFEQGESIHTENSYKYTVEGFAELAARSGLSLEQSWLDKEQLFSVHYLESRCST